MDNNDIVKMICLSENINLTDYFPISEDGERSDKEFDKRFSLDRTYQWEWINFKKRIRFVKHIDNQIRLNILTMKISQVLRDNIQGGRSVYYLNRLIDIPLNRIELPFKLKQLKEKMGR